ncbi:MAG: DNA repair protein RecN [Candidatus Eisenbacteria bacterium]|nr:DNA repair protein RecN [Candidatus Eisenbacteria bacterium]
MLRELSINGLAVVKELSLEFGPGLNVLTGETGAGKSIIVGAIGLLVGEKAGAEMVRSGERVAAVSGVFEPSPGARVSARLEAAGIRDAGHEVVVKRELYADGRSRGRVNGEPVPLSVLKKVGDVLVDFHGQHEHQSLLDWRTHVDYLDSYGGHQELREKVWEACRRVRDARSRLEAFLCEAREAEAQADYMRFQLAEIDAAKMEEGEEEKLEEERKVLQNFERLSSSVKEAGDLLYEDELSCAGRLSRAVRALRAASEIDPKLSELGAELADAEIAVNEAGRVLANYLQSLEFSPGRLDEVETRLALIARLRKKHNGSVSDVLRAGEELRARLSALDSGTEKKEELEAEIARWGRELRGLSLSLLERRRGSAGKMEGHVRRELAGLGMKGTRFVVEIRLEDDEGGDVEVEGKRVRVAASGVGDVQFLISPNVGEETRPLVRIASGGEVSRIMLALKTVLVRADDVDVMVFDEVDAGIGGKVARVVGEKLKALSGAKQIICITHIPMIASLGDVHFSVSKEVDAGRTFGTARVLGKKDRVEELARMLAGDKASPVTLRQAKEMLEYAAAQAGAGPDRIVKTARARSSVG